MTYDVAALVDECARLRLERADERRRREAAEREVMELRRRLKSSTDEAQMLRQRCSAIEGDVWKTYSQRSDVLPTHDALPSDNGSERELFALEGAVDKLCEQRGNLTGDLEGIRRQLQQVLSATGG